MTLQSRTKNTNFNENKTKSKMENGSQTRFYRDESCASALRIAYQKQTCDELELAKEKRRHFSHRLFCPRDIFNICVLSQCIIYWIYTFRIYILLHIKKHYFMFIHFFDEYPQKSKKFCTRDHSFSTYARFSKKWHFLPSDMHTYVHFHPLIHTRSFISYKWLPLNQNTWKYPIKFTRKYLCVPESLF